MPQIINIAGAESPLYQALVGLHAGLQNWVQFKAEQRRQEEEQRRAAAQDFAQRLSIASLIRQNAGETPVAQAPTVQTVEDMAGEAGVPPMHHDVASFAGLQPPPTPTPKRALMLQLPGGRQIPLAPLQYKEEVDAERLKDLAATEAAKADVMDVPNDASMWGPLAGKTGVRVSTANAYMNALQRKDTAEQNRIARQAMAEAAAADRQAARDAAAGARSDTRADRSYQFNSTQLESTAKPLLDQAERFGRLVETVGARTPAADALVAPELLTVMAGGTGSGLRMSEAEIARVVKGRSNWENLKAALAKWSLDPSKALSITDAQRGQMWDLIGAMHKRISDKVAAINDARQALIDASTPEEHRRVLAGLKEKLGALTVGAGAPEATPAGAEPTPTTQAEYDALPSGTIYLDSMGRRRRKP